MTMISIFSYIYTHKYMRMIVVLCYIDAIIINIQWLGKNNLTQCPHAIVSCL